MGKYMVLYKSTATAAEQMAAASADPAQAAAAMELWGRWAEKAGDAILDLGAPLNEVSSIPSGSDGGGIHIGGYSLLQSDSVDAVNDLLKDHPHFHSPGASIEVLEIMAMPRAG